MPVKMYWTYHRLMAAYCEMWENQKFLARHSVHADKHCMSRGVCNRRCIECMNVWNCTSIKFAHNTHLWIVVNTFRTKCPYEMCIVLYFLLAVNCLYLPQTRPTVRQLLLRGGFKTIAKLWGRYFFNSGNCLAEYEVGKFRMTFIRMMTFVLF